MSASTIDHLPLQLSTRQVEAYREDGFVKVESIISKDEAAAFRDAAFEVMNSQKSRQSGDVFSQHVNVWTSHEILKRLTLHPDITKAATILSGTALRLWHDHLLIKKPQNKTPTEFHQDQPYWPHVGSVKPISCWVALCDVPVERGCMTFIPGSHTRTDLSAQSLLDRRSLFERAPDLEWAPRVTLPLRAGDCTFHHGRCAHMANANDTDEARVALAIIYIDSDTRFDGRSHCVTDPLDLKPGEAIAGDLFPSVE